MALKTLMLKKNLDAKRNALKELETRSEGFATREAELVESINEATSEEEKKAVEEAVEAFDAEKTETESEIASVRSEIEAIENEIADIEKDAPAPNAESRKAENTMEMITRDSKQYIDAFANYIKTGEATEVRTLLTENASGTIAVPTFVEDIIHTAWNENRILSKVSKSFLRGNLKLGFEISGSDAVVHTEGSGAIDEETLTLGIVTLTPSNIKKWVGMSDEAIDLNGEAFLRYIYAELSYKITKKLADLVVDKIKALPSTATSTSPNAAQVTAAPAMGTVATAMANLCSDAINPVVIMNRLTWAKFKDVQYANEFNADPFEGLEVLFTEELPAYDSASDSAVYMIVGDLGAVRANFPNGETIKFVYDDITGATADIVKVVGKEFVAVGVVACKHFTNVKKPSTV